MNHIPRILDLKTLMIAECVLLMRAIELREAPLRSFLSSSTMKDHLAGYAASLQFPASLSAKYCVVSKLCH